MTAVLGAAALAIAVVAGGCEGRGAGAPTAAVVEKKSELAAAEDGFLARRDALLARRVELRQKKADLDDRRRTIVLSGGDTSEVDAEVAQLASSETSLVDEEKQLNDKLDQLLTQRRAMMEQLGGGDDLAGREAALAAREKDVARRESRLAEREVGLSSREDGMARRWKESCTLGGTTIVQAANPAGTRYDRRDVEPLLATARAEMARRGVLAFDLSESARGLEAEAGRAMTAGDYSTARLAAAQLVKSIKAVKIDRGFIAGKIGRLNAQVKGKTLTSEVERLFREATSSYGDGKFGEANRKLNKIYFAVN
jgi:hypothetical protein